MALAAAAALTLGGCMSGPSVYPAVHNIQDPQLDIYWVRVHPRSNGVLVTGNVRRADMSRTVHRGHLHVSADVIGAATPVSVDTRWTGTLSTRVRRSARFSVLIPGVEIDAIRSIDVAYRREPDSKAPTRPDEAVDRSNDDAKN